MKLRIFQSPGYVEAYRALGANPRRMAYNQLIWRFKEKVVDGGGYVTRPVLHGQVRRALQVITI